MILRSEVENIARKLLPEKITVPNMIEGECDVPELIKNVYSTLISTSSRG